MQLHGAPPTDAQRTVLIVEDEADLAALLSDILESAGFAVSFATAGQAVRCVVNTGPDALVLDYSMPGTTGAEIVRQVRLACPNGSPPVLLVTGMADVERIAAEMDVDAFLRKPFDVDAFVGAVSRLVRG